MPYKGKFVTHYSLRTFIQHPPTTIHPHLHNDKNLPTHPPSYLLINIHRLSTHTAGVPVAPAPAAGRVRDRQPVPVCPLGRAPGHGGSAGAVGGRVGGRPFVRNGRRQGRECLGGEGVLAGGRRFVGWHGVLWFTVLYCTVLYCTILCCTVLGWTGLQYSAVLCFFTCILSV